jgi:pyruvate dehydrogenase E2 component (dihydrolipoamide acetyltransferase)
VVEELVVEPGVEVPVGTVLARLTPLEETAAPRPPPAEPGPRPSAPPATKAVPAKAVPAKAVPAKAVRSGRASHPPAAARPPTPGFVRASPRARREAAAAGVDLAALSGSGPGGAVLVEDVRATPGRRTEPRTSEDRQAAMRHAIGELMARSKREIPHYYLATTVDMSGALEWLAETNVARPVTERLLPAALLLRATALAAREHPAMNGFWDGGFRPSPAVHLGVAVSLRAGGLVAPAIHDADQLDLDGLMRALRDLVQRARTGGLRGSEMADPTITVTNLGDQGAEEVFGVIYPPQVALVGFGRIVERPWASDGMLGVRPVVRATLAADHRVSDGHDGARFLASVERLLQDPQALCPPTTEKETP